MYIDASRGVYTLHSKDLPVFILYIFSSWNGPGRILTDSHFLLIGVTCHLDTDQ